MGIDVNKDLRDIKSNFFVETLPEKTYLIALAIHKLPDCNTLQRIPSSYGTPIGGYVYDECNKYYVVSCTDMLGLGHIPIAYNLRMKDNPEWSLRVPLTEKVIHRHMNKLQRSDYRHFKNNYLGSNAVSNCRVEFFQLVTT